MERRHSGACDIAVDKLTAQKRNRRSKFGRLFSEAEMICHNLPMCGRYRSSRRKQIIAELFDTAAPWDDDWYPRYNIAPTQHIPVIRQNPKELVRELSLMRWGLIPSWARDGSSIGWHDQREVGNGSHEAQHFGMR